MEFIRIWTYLRERLTVARELLTESGSIFVQIGDENVHRVRAVMDEVFGADNFCAALAFQKTARGSASFIAADLDYIIWYGNSRETVKYRAVKVRRRFHELRSYKYTTRDLLAPIRTISEAEKANLSVVSEDPSSEVLVQISFLGSQDPGRPEDRTYKFQNRDYDVGAHRHWKTSNPIGLDRLAIAKASRIFPLGRQLNYKRLSSDSSHADVGMGVALFRRRPPGGRCRWKGMTRRAT